MDERKARAPPNELQRSGGRVQAAHGAQCAANPHTPIGPGDRPAMAGCSTLAADGGAVWSPDGKKIYVERGRHGKSDVYAMNGDGSGQRNLSRNPERPD